MGKYKAGDRMPDRSIACPHGRLRYRCTFCDPERSYKRMLSNASAGNRTVSLTLTDWLQLMLRPCYLCGGRSFGLDRQDETRGYDLNNVEPCCVDCAFVRNRPKGGSVPPDSYREHCWKVVCHWLRKPKRRSSKPETYLDGLLKELNP